jgi:hypothetical protein
MSRARRSVDAGQKELCHRLMPRKTSDVQSDEVRECFSWVRIASPLAVLDLHQHSTGKELNGDGLGTSECAAFRECRPTKGQLRDRFGGNERPEYAMSTQNSLPRQSLVSFVRQPLR